MGKVDAEAVVAMLFGLEFVLAYLVSAIAATVFLYLSGVPLYITFFVMMASSYISMYMIYSGTWKIVGGLLGLVVRRPKNLPSPFPLNVLASIAKKIRSSGQYIAERHPVIIFIAFVLTPLPQFPSAIIVALRVIKPKGVVPFLISMNFFRTLLTVLSVYYFPALI